MILVHGFAGAVTTHFTLKFFKTKNISKKKLNILWFLGVTSGVLCDFDLIFVFLDSSIEHRKLITHSIFPYLAAFLSVLLFLRFLRYKINKKNYVYYKIIAITTFIGVLSHLFLDFFVGGLVLFAPFTNYYFGYPLPYSAGDTLWKFNYFTSYYLFFELMVFVLFLGIYKKLPNKMAKFLPFFYFLVASVVILV